MERIATSIEMLFQRAEEYSKTSLELLQLKVINKLADVLSSITALIAVGVVLALFSLFFNIGLGLYLGKLFGDYYLGFFAVSGFYLILALIMYLLKDTLIKRKISDIVISALIQNKK
ncbi:MAG: hypothetical protein H7221_03045 [Flavobacterium sp.]|nr:hypothetical protein [Flavobacterium sp.]